MFQDLKGAPRGWACPIAVRIPSQLTSLLLAFSSLAMNACVLHVDLGSGNLTTRSVEMPAFDRVDTRSFLDVEVTPGPVQSVTVTCDDNLQENIDIFVEEGTLVLDSVDSMNIHASPGCKAQVALPALSAARTRGSGLLQVTGLPCTQMHLQSDGSGDIIYAGQCAQLQVMTFGSGDLMLDGQSQNLSLETRGSGDIDAQGWTAQHVSALTFGSGDISVNAQQSIVATSEGSGDIEISGPAPHRQITNHGSGDIFFDQTPVIAHSTRARVRCIPNCLERMKEQNRSARLPQVDLECSVFGPQHRSQVSPSN